MIDIDVLADSPDNKQPVPDSPALASVNQIVEEWDLLQSDLVELAKRVARREERVREIESILLPQAMEQAGLTSFVTKSGRSVTIEDKVNGNIPAATTISKEKNPERRAALLQRREDAFRIVEEKWPGLVKTELNVSLGRGDLDVAIQASKLLREQLNLQASIDKTIHPSTLNSHFKELRDMGKLEEIPVEPFALYIGPYAKIK